MYIINIVDTIDKLERVVTCKDNDELANLLLHLDKQYEIVHITQIPSYVNDYKELLKKDDTLEIGKS